MNKKNYKNKHTHRDTQNTSIHNLYNEKKRTHKTDEN